MILILILRLKHTKLSFNAANNHSQARATPNNGFDTVCKSLVNNRTSSIIYLLDSSPLCLKILTWTTGYSYLGYCRLPQHTNHDCLKFRVSLNNNTQPQPPPSKSPPTPVPSLTPTLTFALTFAIYNNSTIIIILLSTKPAYTLFYPIFFITQGLAPPLKIDRLRL